jgi:hypothetical protein
MEQTPTNDVAATIEISDTGREKAQLTYGKWGDNPEFDALRHQMMNDARATREATGWQGKPAKELEVYPLARDMKEDLASALMPKVTDNITFTYQPTENHIRNVFTYQKFEGTSLQNIEDSEISRFASDLRDGYYRYLFYADNQRVNDILDKGFYDLTLSCNRANTMENNLARYEELREEINRVFGHDQTMLAKNLASLDTAFEWQMADLARATASEMQFHRDTAQYGWNSDYPAFETNRLATHRDFNRDEFEKSAVTMMRDFAKSYTANINGGLSYAAALEGVFASMNFNYGLTTSVNNLSFADFLLLNKHSTAHYEAQTLLDTIAKRDQASKAFNNSSEMSSKLRSLLDGDL